MRKAQHNPHGVGAVTFRRAELVLLAALLVTAAVFWQTRRAQLGKFRSRFESDAAARTALIMQETDKSLLAIKSLGWFFDGAGNVDDKRFHAFAAACLPERRELQAMQWIPQVSSSERAGFESKARGEVLDQFRITERGAGGRLVAAAKRETYYPVLYTEPLWGNEAAVGFDVGSDAVRRAALERARDTGDPAVTEPIQLVQQEGGQVGFLIFVPVFQQSLPQATVGERRAALLGFAVGVYQPERLVSAAMRDVEPMGLSLAFLDRSAPVGRQLMCRWHDMLRADRSWKSFLFPAPPRTTDAFTFCGRELAVETTADTAYMEQRFPIAYWLVWPTGLLLGSLAALYVGTILSSRKRMELMVVERTAELCQTQDRLRLVLDAIPVRVHWKSRDSVYMGCNRRFAEDAELKSPEEVAGKTDFDLPWKDYAEGYRERDRKVIESGQPMIDYEQMRCSSDGVVLWLRQSKLPLRDARGDIIGVLSVYEDITNRKQAEESLRESEARYRAVVENSADGMGVTVENRLVYVNSAAMRLAGARDAKELVGHFVLEFLPKEDWPENERRRATILETGLPGPVIEGKLRRPDGRYIEAEWKEVPIVYDGKRAILSSFRDMTEHRRRAQALQAIVRATAGSGEKFFTALVAELGKVLGVKYALVGVLRGREHERVRTVALWRDGAIVQNCESELNGTPCAEVIRDGLFYCPSGMRSQFPADELLADKGIESYLGVPLHSQSGAALGVLCVMDDEPMSNSDLARSLMTIFASRAASELEREEALEGLKSSEARYRQLHKSMMDAFVAADLDGRVTECNETFRQMLGYGPEEMLTLRYEDITPPEWQARDAKIRQTQVLARGYSDIYEKEYCRKDGTLFPVELRVILLRDDAGKAYGMWAIVRDVSLRKWAQSLLAGEKRVLERIASRKALPEVLKEICRFIEEHSPGVQSSVMLLDADGTHLWPIAAPKLPAEWVRAITPLVIGPSVGSCGAAAWGKEQVVVSDIANDPRWTAYPEISALALRCGLRACWSTPILSGSGELLGTFAMYYKEPQSPQASEMDIIKQVTHLASVAIEHDRAVEGLRRAHDELEQRVHERTVELLRANERLEELDRLKSQFLATMSHELRTPLNTIIGFTTILQQGFAGPVNDEQKKQLGLVVGSSKHLLSLINDLLDLSRVEAGKVDIDRDPFDFVDVIQDVVQSLLPTAAQKNLRIATDLPGTAIEMLGDRKRCFQVLLNLTNNAVKFTSRGEVKISARCEGNRLRVCVADTGIGIKPEQMGLLFEAFRQLDSTAKRIYEGTGLGLHLCRRLLGLMGGEISAESEFGKGSRFTFTLPRQLAGRPAAQERSLEDRYEDLKRR